MMNTKEAKLKQTNSNVEIGAKQKVKQKVFDKNLVATT